ncbi:MAG: arylsulfotransferase family protein [Candidatus Dormibacteria bacterium]
MPGANRTAATRAPLPTSASCSKVSVFPSPGAKTASPTTQISFRNISPAAIEASGVQVAGSITGPHDGAWVADSDGDGASFYPTVHFLAGETVQVEAGLGICGASGSSYHFRIAKPPGPLAASSKAKPSPSPKLQQPTRTYKTMPSVQVPKLTVTVPASFGDEYVLETPHGGTKPGGPMIVGGKGQLIWFQPLAPAVIATDLRVQSYQGQPVLTYWKGAIINGHGIGEDLILNSAYQPLKTLVPGDGYAADLHEFLLSQDGSTAWMTAYNEVGWNLSSVGGPKDGAVLDGIVQEIDVATGNVLFEWHSLDHVAVNLTNQKVDTSLPFDYFHVNSVDPLDNGTVVISSRHTSTVYGVAQATGRVLWRLGGKASSFRMGKGTHFALQHDAEVRGPDTISIFDDEDAPPSSLAARGLVLHLDFQTRRATLESAYPHSGLKVPAQGNVEFLANGNVFIGWGSGSYTSEFTKGGQLVFDAHFGSAINSYRAYLHTWVGIPATKPALATSAGGQGALVVYASWNGSTETSAWEVLGGPDASHLSELATAPRQGFQTAVPVSGSPKVVEVVALGASGQALASSQAQPVGTGS